MIKVLLSLQIFWKSDQFKPCTQVGKAAWEAWILETPLEDIKIEVEKVAMTVQT